MTEDRAGLDGFDQELPRHVQLRLGVSPMLWVTSVGLAIALAFTILIGSLTARHTSQLMSHGVHVRGRVSRLMILGKNGNDFEVVYRFTDPAPPDPMEAFQMGQAQVTEAQYYRLYVGAAVDVVFLPLRPDISRLGFQLPRKLQDAWLPLKAAIAALLLLAAVGALAFTWACWRERRLLQWGRHSVATVREVRVKYYGRFPIILANFEFVDSVGITRQGVARAGGGAAAIRHFAVGDTATVLYDPSHPDRSDLYPFWLLMLASKPRSAKSTSHKSELAGRASSPRRTKTESL